MRRFFTIIFLVAMLAVTVFVASGEDVLPHYKGVVVSREKTSVANYSYLVFTNTNNVTVSVNYVVKDGIRGDIVLKSNESKRSYVACADNAEVDIKVKFVKDNQRKKETKIH